MFQPVMSQNCLSQGGEEFGQRSDKSLHKGAYVSFLSSTADMDCRLIALVL